MSFHSAAAQKSWELRSGDYLSPESCRLGKKREGSLKALTVNGSLWRGGRRTFIPSSSQWHWWASNWSEISWQLNRKKGELSRAKGQQAAQILVTIILSLPASDKERNSSISLNPACASETLLTAEGLQVPEEDKKGGRHLVKLRRREGGKSTREGTEMHKKVQKCQTQIKLQNINTFLSFARRIQKPFQGASSWQKNGLMPYHTTILWSYQMLPLLLSQAIPKYSASK